MKKTKLLKSLLVAAGLMVGASVWAGTTSTIYEKSLTGWTSDDVTKTEGTVGKWYNSSGIASNDYLTGMNINSTYGLRLAARNTTATASLTLNRTANTIVTVDAVWNVGSATSDGNTPHNQFIYGDLLIQQNVRSNNLTTTYKINGKTTTVGTDKFSRESDMTIHLKVNSLSGEITEFYLKNGETTVAQFSDLTDNNNTFASGSNYDKIQMLSWISASSSYAWCAMKSITVQQETQDDVTTADYTVNWVCDNTTVKTETRNAAVGSTIGLASSDTDAFFNSDDSERYLYVSNDLNETTVSENGTTVVTITVRKAEKWSWTATAKYEGTALAYTQTGEVWEDLNCISVAYPRFLAVGNQLVEKTPNGNDLRQSATVTADNFNVDLVYTEKEGVNNLYLLSEAEDLNTGIATNATTFTSRVSNGLIIHASEGTLLSLPTGKYIFTLGAIGGDNNNHKVSYVVKADETTIAEGTCTGNTLNLFTGEEFTLTANSTPITFTCSDPASSRGIDLIYIQKTSTEAQDKALRVYNIIGLGNDWDTDHQMTQSSVEGEEDIYTYTTTMVVKGNEEDKYFEYKVRQDSNWDGYKLPNEGNASWKNKVNGIGIYTLTFTADVANHTLAVEATKEDFEYAVVGCTWDGSTEIHSDLFAGETAWYTSTTDVMTKQADGTLVWKKNEVELPAKWIDLKVIARNGDEVIAWFGNNGANVGLNINETGAGTYYVTVTFDGSNVTATAEQKHAWTVAGSNTTLFGTAWAADATDNDMTRNDEGIWTITYENKTLAASTIEYKIVQDHSWDNAYGYNGGNATVTIPADGEYNVTFTFNAATKETGCEIVPTIVSKTISDAGYATYCSPYALNFANVEGLTAYRAVVSGSNVSFEEVTEVPAGEGVLLKGAEASYTIPTIATAEAIENDFVGVLEDTHFDKGIFVLMKGANGVGFYKTNNDAGFTVRANSAYLPAQASARSFIGFDFDDITTGTQSIEGVAAVKMQSNEVYNLQGQRVTTAKKGLYIINGKKMVVK